MSATRAVGNKLSQASDDLVIKQFRLMPSQITNFRKKFGEDPSAVIKRYNLTGKDSEGIKQAVIAPLQGEFDSIASKIPAIPTTTIQKAFKTKYDKLLNSAVQDNKAVGLQLKKQADEIVKKYGDTIDGSEVASLRREFDSLVSYADKAANPARYNVNKRAADALRSALQETADKVGLKSTDGKSFKEVGAELNKLRQLTDNIGKQENLGRGNLPFSLGNTPGTIIGSAAGPVGAFAGYAGNAVVNSPAGRRAIAATAEKAGTRFTQAADRSNPYSVSQLAGRILPASALGAALSGQSDLINSSTNANPTTTSANTPNAANITELYQALNNSSIDNSSLDSGPFAPENLQNSIQTILANGGDLKDASEFIGLAKALQDIKDTSSKKEKPLSAEAAKTVSNARAGLSALDTIEQQLLNDPSVQQKSAISGTFNPSGLTARLLGTGTYENARQQAVDLIARIRTGAAVTKEEAKRFEVFLPQPSDTPETIRQKMKILREQFEMVANRSGTAGNDLQVALSA
ncbi:MAG TPA: hypothetical protein VJ836_00815 [Candidatus Saccharimonadales bacterium]|nr:hypothetical protein [Candidatus Saccharimonadales bacterium]